MAARLRTIKVYQQKILDLLGLRLLSNEMTPLLNKYYKKELKFINSMARLLERELVNRRGIDLSKELLLVSVVQRALELPVVKVGGQKKKFCRPLDLQRSTVPL